MKTIDELLSEYLGERYGKKDRFTWRLEYDQAKALLIKSLEIILGKEPIIETWHESAVLWLMKPTRWLVLCGPTGTGKTVLARAICAIYRTLSEVLRYKGGTQIISEFSAKDVPNNIRHSSYLNLFIDDIGREEDKRSYGNISNQVEECIEHLYNEDGVLIMTTNLRPTEIEKVYGSRASDRMIERATFILCGYYEAETRQSFRQPTILTQQLSKANG